MSSKKIANNTVLVDDQYTLYELHDAFDLNTPIPDQLDIFLWLSDYFCLNKGKEGFIRTIVFNEAWVVSIWNIVSHNGDGKGKELGEHEVLAKMEGNGLQKHWDGEWA